MTSTAQLGSWGANQILIDPDMDPEDGKPSASVKTLNTKVPDIATMRSKLKAKDSSTYTDDYMDTLNANDLLYACRTTL